MDLRMILAISQVFLNLVILIAGSFAFIKVKFNDLKHIEADLKTLTRVSQERHAENKKSISSLDTKLDTISDRLARQEGICSVSRKNHAD